MSRLRNAALTLTVLASAWAAPAHAIYIRTGTPVSEFNALAANPAFQSAGYLGHVGQSRSSCSGTLIAPNLFLTAAHCVAGVSASDLTVGFALNFPAGGLGPNNVEQVFINPDYNPAAAYPTYDNAVIKLTAPVTGITPARIDLGNPTGLLATLVGYGLQAYGDSAAIPSANAIPGANNRLAAQTISDSFNPNQDIEALFSASSPLALEGSGAPHDSGSPLYVDGLTVGDLSGVYANTPGDPFAYGAIDSWAPLSNPETLSFLRSISSQILFVPEPSSLPLLLLAVAATYLQARNRRAASAMSASGPQ